MEVVENTNVEVVFINASTSAADQPNNLADGLRSSPVWVYVCKHVYVCVCVCVRVSVFVTIVTLLFKWAWQIASSDDT